MLIGRHECELKGKPSGCLLRGHDLIEGKEERKKKKMELNSIRFNQKASKSLPLIHANVCIISFTACCLTMRL